MLTAFGQAAQGLLHGIWHHGKNERYSAPLQALWVKKQPESEENQTKNEPQVLLADESSQEMSEQNQENNEPKADDSHSFIPPKAFIAEWNEIKCDEDDQREL